MALIISHNIEQKLLHKHNVTENEVRQCFANRDGHFLIDDREEHQTNPKTNWFIAETDYGRQLRVYFVPKGDDIYLKTALEPKQHHINTYNNRAY